MSCLAEAGSLVEDDQFVSHYLLKETAKVLQAGAHLHGMH